MERPNFTPTHDFIAHDHRILMEVKPHWTDFKAYEITSEWYENDQIKYGYDNGTHPTEEDLSKVEETISGYIKWDGCMEFDTHPHLCGSHSVINFTKLLVYIWSKGISLMEDSDLIISGPLPKNWENYGGE